MPNFDCPLPNKFFSPTPLNNSTLPNSSINSQAIYPIYFLSVLAESYFAQIFKILTRFILIVLNPINIVGSSSIKGQLPTSRVFLPVVAYHQRQSFSKCSLHSKVIFHKRSSFIKGGFHDKWSSIKVCLLSKLVFHQRFLYNQNRISSKDVFNQSQSFIKGPLKSQVVMHPSGLLSKVVFH